MCLLPMEPLFHDVARRELVGVISAFDLLSIPWRVALDKMTDLFCALLGYIHLRRMPSTLFV